MNLTINEFEGDEAFQVNLSYYYLMENIVIQAIENLHTVLEEKVRDLQEGRLREDSKEQEQPKKKHGTDGEKPLPVNKA